MKKYTYANQGVCSSRVSFELEDKKVYNVSFQGGCHGNLKAISILADGMEAEELIKKLEGNTCGYKNTSCADQFAQALKKALNEEQ